MSTTKCFKGVAVLLVKVFGPPASFPGLAMPLRHRNRLSEKHCRDFVTKHEMHLQRQADETGNTEGGTPLPPHLSCYHMGGNIAPLYSLKIDPNFHLLHKPFSF